MFPEMCLSPLPLLWKPPRACGKTVRGGLFEGWIKDSGTCLLLNCEYYSYCAELYFQSYIMMYFKKGGLEIINLCLNFYAK